MATKSPGIYVNEIDNTSYVNVKSTTGTNVCVIGYARKGPIGVPTEIYSYNAFIKTFGYPIKGTYSAMAVRNVLSAGGGILYVRIADENTASPSKYVVKNSIPFKFGRTYFKKNTSITKGTYGYNTNSNYVFDVQTTNGQTKTLFLRSTDGMWHLSKVFEQISTQLNATEGWQELNANSKTLDKTGLFSFNFKVNGEPVSANPYYMVISAGTTTTIETLASRISKAISSGSNAFFELNIYGSVASPSGAINGIANIDTVTEIVEEGTLAFNIDDEDGKTVYVGYTDQIGSDGSTKTTTPVSITFAPGSYTYADIVSTLNSRLKDNGVYAYFKLGKRNVPSKIVFVSTRADSGFNFGLCSAVVDAPETYSAIKDLFVTAGEGVDTSVFKSATGLGGSVEDAPAAIVVNPSPVYSQVGSKVDTFTVESYGTSLFLRTSVKGVGNKVSAFNDEEHGEYLFDGFTILPTIEGTDPLNISVAKDANGIFFYDATDINPPKVFETDFYSSKFDDSTGMSSNFYNFISLMNGVTEIAGNTKVSALNRDMIVFSSKEKGTGTSNLSVVVKTSISPLYKEEIYTSVIEEYEKYIIDNKAELSTVKAQLTAELIKPEDERDQVAIESFNATIKKCEDAIEEYEALISSKEKEMEEALASYTTHSIIVYQDSTQVEYFEDVSYNINSSKCFSKIINELGENGGSDYVEVEVLKNNFDTDEIEIKDGRYYLGIANSDTDVAKTSAMADEDYNLYDYAEGNDGIIEDPSDLFLEQLDKENSAIMNKDLYDFHVLITPDCNEAMEVQDAAVACCEERGDAMYILDPPIGLSKEAAIDWHNGRGYGRSSGLDNTYVAFYWPWGKTYDSYSESYVWAMPSVYMAAQYCKVDKAAGPWQAPAGDIYGVVPIIDIEVPTTRADRDALYTETNRVNPFIKYGDGTIVCYGEKTMQRKNSTLTKIHTRRMMIQIKKDLRTALNSYIFMPSTSSYLSEINATLNSIMQKYKTAGGVSSFKVVCDATNNTSATLQQDIINASISCVPVGTIEQINIDCSLDKSSESVSVA